ncbi:FecCD family ABC transporter permease [Motilibacter aurantiacus]|uniref:FecCD family ABC transporter permease n=1 Tax=Motilibacter aurantiacus TaxID=2714955 RepID=UPI001407531A|nr:iron chelate uptake ABC transporter family permease subunit [Motilibacter aurantiacus]
MYAVTAGQAGLSVGTVWDVLARHLGLGDTPVSPLHDAVVWELRLPRVLTAAAVGAGLAVAGAVLQTLTRNPLAEPYLLGVSSGASLGAVLVLVAGVGGGVVSLTAGAFAGAVSAFVLVLALGSVAGRITPARMVLAGVALAQLCAATLSFVVLWVASPHATQSAQFWLAGSLTRSSWGYAGACAAVLAGVLLICAWNARSLDALAFGEDAATGLGVPVQALRWLLLVAVALLTAVLVSVSGSIGFVGLILPHAARFLVGPGHARLLPVVTLAGALFLLWMDTLARVVFAPREMPVGLLTALLGVPAFLVLLRRAELRS